ncbi:MAG TPA: hypothetical protein VLG71_02165, partial [Candidatus Limnocylindria bacterium]|nr:hypothetical protein [Candidatus Limnocylindria bacterium]
MKRFFGRVITAWCLVGLLVPSLVAANDQSAAAPRGPITYAELGEQILSAHGLVLNASQVTDDYGVPVLSKQEKRKMLFAALADYEKREEHQGHEAVHEAVRSIIKDLELFYTQGSTNHARTLFTQLDQTTTVFGEAVLAKMLASPTADIGTLRKRQALVSDLVEDQDLFDEVVRIVQQAQKTESSLLSFWMPEDATKKQVVKGFYFTGAVTKQFNKNP